MYWYSILPLNLSSSSPLVWILYTSLYRSFPHSLLLFLCVCILLTDWLTFSVSHSVFLFSLYLHLWVCLLFRSWLFKSASMALCRALVVSASVFGCSALYRFLCMRLSFSVFISSPRCFSVSFCVAECLPLALFTSVWLPQRLQRRGSVPKVDPFCQRCLLFPTSENFPCAIKTQGQRFGAKSGLDFELLRPKKSFLVCLFGLMDPNRIRNVKSDEVRFGRWASTPRSHKNHLPIKTNEPLQTSTHPVYTGLCLSNIDVNSVAC